MATLNVPSVNVNAPPGVSPVAAPLDFSKLAPEYYAGQQSQHQLEVQNAFRGGLPTDASGQPDFRAAAMKLFQMGAPEQAGQMMQAGINQQAFDAARQELGTPLPGQPAATGSGASSPIQNSAGDYYSINHALESAGDPHAKNPNGPAYGLAGFMPDTWAHLVQAHPELGLPADITKSTAEQQEAASRALTGENVGYLAQNGIPVTDRTARMANFLGSHGAVHFFTSLAQNPAAPAAQIFPGEAKENPESFYNPGANGKPNLASPRTLAQVLQYETTILPQLHGLPPLGAGNTTGFNFQPQPRGQGRLMARAADGTPVATNAQGQAIDPRTGQPTQNAPVAAAPVYRNPAANAFAGDLAAQAAADGGTAPGGAASAGSPAAANAARVAQSAMPGNGENFGALAEPAQGDAASAPTRQSSYVENLAKPPPSNPAPAQPAPQRVAPPNRPGLMDPTLAGLVPQGVDPGAYAAALYKRAGVLGLSPATKAMGDAYKDQADKIMAAVTASVTSRSPALQEYQLNAQQKPDGTWETPGETQARVAGETETAKLKAQNEQSLEKVQPTPGGPTQFDTKAHLLDAIKNGAAGANSSVGPGAGSPPGGGGVPSNLPVAEQPAFVAQRQEQIAKDENTMLQQYQARQIAKERLGELANLQETFETGDLAGAKAKAQAFAAAVGMPFQNTATMNAAAFEQFTKNAVANVFDNVKSMGGRVLVSEIAGLSKANANPEMQPGANAKIIGQGAGILNYEDKHMEDYFNWKQANKNAYDTSGFEIPWIKQHPVSEFTGQADKQMAPLGAVTPIPKSPADLKPGVYRFPNKPGVWNWDGKQFTPEARPASERLFPKVSVTNG